MEGKQGKTVLAQKSISILRFGLFSFSSRQTEQTKGHLFKWGPLSTVESIRASHPTVSGSNHDVQVLITDVGLI